ncbi:hypothetical protein T265_11023 [Opisthorchis viverrini]|uniref:Uncharacterized protein n=1 Tax=Opisthorchis viverrini TaxID=6198 RepID=A0A074Z4G6_OPIVI|nr:hypothetical protein T265_11023 [Opisthorchis viverrini]KER20422.1 hypothetical protein T265_11023 [Opisthorchis viverrini]
MITLLRALPLDRSINQTAPAKPQTNHSFSLQTDVTLKDDTKKEINKLFVLEFYAFVQQNSGPDAMDMRSGQASLRWSATKVDEIAVFQFAIHFSELKLESDR